MRAGTQSLQRFRIVAPAQSRARYGGRQALPVGNVFSPEPATSASHAANRVGKLMSRMFAGTMYLERYLDTGVANLLRMLFMT